LGLVFHTKKYKYNRCEHKCKIKDVWGETIEKVAIIIAILALAICAAPVMAKESSSMMSGTDVLGNGIFESSDGLNFPEGSLSGSVLADTNFDSITVGNDRANAYGFEGFFPFESNPAKATNNLEVKKNQQVGPLLNNSSVIVNIDQVHIGDRSAQAYGNAEAVNNVKLVLNQAP
jgi:hypothetical protein